MATSPTTATTATTASCPGPSHTRPRSGSGTSPTQPPGAPVVRREAWRPGIRATGGSGGGSAGSASGSRVGLGVGLDVGLGVGDRADPAVSRLRGAATNGRELAGQQLEPPGDGGVVVGGVGSAAHVDDARAALRPAPRTGTGGCGG